MNGKIRMSCRKDGTFFVPREPALQEDFTETAFGLNMGMGYVAGGEFVMGATAEQEDEAWEDEKPLRGIKLDGFHIGRYAVTQAQWRAVMGTTLEEQREKVGLEWSPAGKGDDHPMYYVSWMEAQDFCKRLSKKTGKKYVLPTEAMWEYAARGGDKSRHYRYAGSNDLDEVAWYRKNSIDLASEHADYGTRPVGRRKDNELGLYDMLGNVWEWCSDWYGKYDGNDTENPSGPATGTLRVYRGGSWYGFARDCRVSCRYYNLLDHRYYNLGFRVACIL